MDERTRTGGNYMPEDAIRGRRAGAVKRRAHPVTVRIDEDLYRAVLTESEVSRLTLSAVMRLALAHGVERVAADRIAREVAG